MGKTFDAVRQTHWSISGIIMLAIVGGCGGSVFRDAMQTDALSPAKKFFVPKTATYKYRPMEYLAAACNIDTNGNKSVRSDYGTIPPWVPLTFKDVRKNSELHEMIRFIVLEDEECIRLKEKVALVDSMLNDLQLSDENQRMRHNLMLIKGFCYYECKE